MARINSTARTINGTPGFDFIDGGPRNQIINGGAGNDEIEGWGGFDIMNGGAGHDLIIGGGASDGGEGNDYMVAWSYTPSDQKFRDTMIGGPGDDTMIEFFRDVTMDAGPGNDSMMIGDVDYTVYTGSGVDLIDAGSGKGKINVDGGGSKTIYTQGGDHVLNIIDGQVHAHMNRQRVQGDDYWYYAQTDGTNKVKIGVDAEWTSIITGAGDDVFSVAAANTSYNQFFAGDGNDKITGGSGGEHLSGDAGDDTIKGGAGNDELVGGLGHDLLNGGDGDDTVHANGGNDIIWGGNGADTIIVSCEDQGDRTVTIRDFRPLKDDGKHDPREGDVINVSLLYFNGAMATFNNGELAFVTSNGLVTLIGTGINNDAEFMAAKLAGSVVTDGSVG